MSNQLVCAGMRQEVQVSRLASANMQVAPGSTEKTIRGKRPTTRLDNTTRDMSLQTITSRERHKELAHEEVSTTTTTTTKIIMTRPSTSSKLIRSRRRTYRSKVNCIKMNQVVVFPCIKLLLLLSLLSASILIMSSSPTTSNVVSGQAVNVGDPLAGSPTSPVRITIQPNDLVAIEGESAELNCDAEGEPEPSIEWYHNGQLIKSSTFSRTTLGGSIQFLNIRPAHVTSSLSSSSSSSSGQLRQAQMQDSDVGVYYCLAKNQFGEAKSRTATLQVAYIKEEFRSLPKDRLATRGDTVTFECLPQAWPEPRIRWRHNGRLIDPNEFRLADGSPKYLVQRIATTDSNTTSPNDSNNANNNSNNNVKPSTTTDVDEPTRNQQQQQQQPDNLVDLFGSQLVIKQVDKGDEGAYSCLVETRGSHRLIERESSSAMLTTGVRPYFIEAPEHRSAQVGEQVRLKCRMGGDPEPVISWRRQNGQPLSDKITIDPNDKTLILDSLRVTDQGIYICEGENPAGSARSMAQVSVNSRPRFTVQPVDQEVEAGSRLQFNCAGEANPQPMLFWYKEGHRQLLFPPPSSKTNSRQFSNRASFVWPQASPLLASANDFNRNPYGSTSDTSPAINNLFTMPLSPDQSSFGNNYFGNRIYVDNQGSLNIVNATSSDNGYYACALISPVGSVLAKAKLTVKQPMNHLGALSEFYSQDTFARMNGLSSVSGKYDSLPPPVIKMGSANQTLPTNTSTTLYCDVVSQVAYKIQWFINSQPLQEEPPRVLVLENGALNINDLRTTDTGTYTCVVTAAINDQNMPLASPSEPLDSSMLTSAPPIPQSTTHSCYLRVGNPINPNLHFFRMETYDYPSSPGTPQLVSTNGNDAITIAWSPPVESGKFPVRQYVVEHYDTSQEHLGWRVIHRPNGIESLLIDGLSAEGSHFFVVRATNSHGTGPSSAIAGPMRTVAGETRYQAEQQRKNPSSIDLSEIRPEASFARDRLMTISTNLLNLSPISSSSIRLQWTTQSTNNSSDPSGYSPLVASGDYLEGFSIRYRAIGLIENSLLEDSNAPWKSINNPSSLPLVTSFIGESELPDGGLSRIRRDLINLPEFDYTQEFNEVRIADPNAEHYTINGLKPFTNYQFFVVPYYKDIDGVPSNILTAQTSEDKPSVGPANLTLRPINNTSIRLLWLHIPGEFANGVLRGYAIRLNRSDSGLDQQSSASTAKVLNIPFTNLVVAPLTTLNPETRIHPNLGGLQHKVVMYDISNLTFKSFYSVQVAGLTSIGTGPWSEELKFVMDFNILSDMTRFPNNVFEDVVSKSSLSLSNIPQPYNPSAQNQGYTSAYFVVPTILMIISCLLIAGFLLYRRNNQKVVTWKKTISEHFTNKFYMPSTVDHNHRGPNSIQQNVYGHQQHLIYSAGSTHMAHQPMSSQTMWAASNATGCLNSSGTGSLSSHGGLLPINTDPNATRTRVNNDQIFLMNNNGNGKDIATNPRFIRGNNGHLINQESIDVNLGNQPNHQVIHHGGDHYSVINNVADYEELDQQRIVAGMNSVVATTSDRHQTGSSNSDTSCPSSVTRLLPNQNFNRDILSRGISDQQRHEMILQQQIGCNGEVKQPFVAMMNGSDTSKFQQNGPLSPYATTNLMNQMPMQHQQQQIFSGAQLSQIDQSRQQHKAFVLHNGQSTLDDSKIFMAHQINGVHGQHQLSSFRTLQRPMDSQHRGMLMSQAQNQPNQLVMQNDGARQLYERGAQFQGNKLITNINTNPLSDMKSNFYEHIDYNDLPQNSEQRAPQNDMISSSTSSGSMRSPPQQSDQANGAVIDKFRQDTLNDRLNNEAHDLRVFSSTAHQVSDCVAERQRLTGGDHQILEEGTQNNGLGEEENDDNADETTAFRQKSCPSDMQRTRQMSKRKRQQQRNRLHNNNQKIG